MFIRHNIAALNALRFGKRIAMQQMKVMMQLSSGYRINSAADDAAGLAVSEKMRAQIRGLSQASRNAQDGISMIQTAEGAMGEIHAMLQRVRELANQSANGTYTDEDRANLDFEVQQLKEAIKGISENTQFNTMNLLDGTLNPGSSDDTSKVTLQVGANAGQTMEVEIDNMGLDKLGVTSTHIATASAASAALKEIDEAIDKVSRSRGKLGAYQNRLEYTIDNLDNQHENLQAAESRIRDTDMAEALMEYVRLNMMSQANLFVLAQAVNQPNIVLALLGQQ